MGEPVPVVSGEQCRRRSSCCSCKCRQGGDGRRRGYFCRRGSGRRRRGRPAGIDGGVVQAHVGVGERIARSFSQVHFRTLRFLFTTCPNYLMLTCPFCEICPHAKVIRDIRTAVCVFVRWWCCTSGGDDFLFAPLWFMY